MKVQFCLTTLLLLILSLPAESHNQATPNLQQSVETLRAQLQDIEAKQAALETRLKQLDEDLRPENIERSLALTGATRPEELRAQRRAQLEKEKTGIQAQLEQLATSRTRIQAALTAAETAIYQQSAASNTSQTQTSPAVNQTTTRPAQSQPTSKRRRIRRARGRRRKP